MSWLVFGICDIVFALCFALYFQRLLTSSRYGPRASLLLLGGAGALAPVLCRLAGLGLLPSAIIIALVLAGTVFLWSSDRFLRRLRCCLLFFGAVFGGGAPILFFPAGTGYNGSAALASGILLFLMLLASVAYLARGAEHRPRNPHRWMFAVILVSQLYILAAYYYTVFFSDSPSRFAVYTVSMIIVILMDVIIFRLMQSIFRQAELESDHRNLLQEQELQQQHLATMRQQSQELLRLNRDIIHHVETLTELKNSGDHAKAETYAKTLASNIISTTFINNCEHKVVDAVLSNKLSYGHSQGIEMQASVSVAQDCPIDNLDLMCVFSNLLDNAIEACMLMPPKARRYVEIATTNQAGILVIKVVNSRGKQSHQKKSGGHMGLGMDIIRNSAAKYDGNCQFSSTSDSFTAVIMLRCQDEKHLFRRNQQV